MPAFYSNPKSLDDMVDHIIGRLLDQFTLDMHGMNRWDGFDGSQAG
jgi:4-hydroxy-3-polyprenylbenzoate decarboxylase